MFKKINKKHLNLWGLFLPLTIFTKEIGMVTLGGIQLDIISYPFFIIAFFIFLFSKKLYISKIEAIVFLLILANGVLVDLLLELPMILFFKQYIPIVIIYFSTKYILKSNNPIYIFEKYVDYAVIAAIIGIVQLLLKPLGILIFTDYVGFFIDSVALEPSHYVIMMLPALLYLYLRKQFYWKFWLILITILFTFKLTALLSIALFFILINLRQYKKMLLVTIPFLAISIYTINVTPEYTDRIDSALAYSKSEDIHDVNNMTTFSFISNLLIASKNFINTYGFGVGLGGHQTTYIRNFNFKNIPEKWEGLNYKSAHALTIRIVSELGLLGIIILVILFYKSLKIKDKIYKSVALASLGNFIAKSFKVGGYFDYGTIFFLVMIIVMIKLDKNKRNSYFRRLK